MYSVNTNLASMAALESLNQTQQMLSQTQNAVSTGQKVASAADNPAVYAISQTMNANIAGLSAVQDSLSFGQAVLTTASKASSSISGQLQSLQQTVTQAQTTGIDPTTMQNQVNSILSNIDQFASSASFNGVNLLQPTAAGTPTPGSAQLNIVQDLSGSTLTIGNQVSATLGNSTATSFTAALGLSSLSVGGAAQAGGFNVSFSNAMKASDFADGSVLTLTGKDSGGAAHTWSFEFNNGGTALKSTPSATNTVVAVEVNNTVDSVPKMLSALTSAMQSQGFGAATQSDGSIDVWGNGMSTTAPAASNAGIGAAWAGDVNAPTAINGSKVAVDVVQTAVTNMNKIGAALGAATQQVSGMQDFTKSLSDALTSGVGALTDADMAAESAKLQSLQTKQQLAIQSLSIANQQPQVLLSLFR